VTGLRSLGSSRSIRSPASTGTCTSKVVSFPRFDTHRGNSILLPSGFTTVKCSRNISSIGFLMASPRPCDSGSRGIETTGVRHGTCPSKCTSRASVRRTAHEKTPWPIAVSSDPPRGQWCRGRGRAPIAAERRRERSREASSRAPTRAQPRQGQHGPHLGSCRNLHIRCTSATWFGCAPGTDGRFQDRVGLGFREE
jgi:hypothetical protein